jgi:hypothetical protein
MGVNNNACRAAKKRRRSATQRASRPRDPQPTNYERPIAFEQPVIHEHPAAPRPDEGAFAEVLVAEAVASCSRDRRLLAPGPSTEAALASLMPASMQACLR